MFPTVYVQVSFFFMLTIIHLIAYDQVFSTLQIGINFITFLDFYSEDNSLNNQKQIITKRLLICSNYMHSYA